MMEYHRSSYANGTSHGLLESSLCNILSFIKPVEEDRVKRLNTINDVRNAIHSVASLKGVSVNPFGSFISNLYTKWGDLDISIQVSSSYSSVGKRQKKNLLHDVMLALRRTGSCRIKFIPQARVPLLVFESISRNISCDISIDNHGGRIKSQMLLWITEIDGRFRDMVLLVKEWAKAHNINDPKSGTLNSYSLCLLVIFHFQTCSPAIFPPLKDIYGGDLVNDFKEMKFVSEKELQDLCADNISKFRSQGGRNKTTLCELVTSFFQKFSRIRDLATDNAICTCSGRWESIQNKISRFGKSYPLFVEDPFEQSDNAARAVGEKGLAMISNAFADTCRKLSSYSVLSDWNALLSVLARPHIREQMGRTPPVQLNCLAFEPPSVVAVTYSVPSCSVVRTTQTATFGTPRRSQFRNVPRVDSQRPSSSSSSSTYFQRQRGGREMQGRTMWVPRNL